MQDPISTATALEAGGLLAALALLVFTVLIAASSVSFDATSRSSLLESLASGSKRFTTFRKLTDAREIAKNSVPLKVLNAVLRILLILPVAVVLFALFGILSVQFWAYLVSSYGLGFMAVLLFGWLSTRSPKAIESICSKRTPAEWSARDSLTSAGLLVTDVMWLLPFSTVYASALGSFVALVDSGFGQTSEMYAVLVAVVDVFLLFGLIIWVGLDRRMEARVFSSYRAQPLNLPVLVDVLLSGAWVIREGKLWGIGDICEVKGARGETYSMSWRKIDLLVGIDYPEHPGLAA